MILNDACKCMKCINEFDISKIENCKPNFNFELKKPTKCKIYIIGGGMSVNEHDINNLKDGDTMVVNRAIEYVDSPDYFITMDYSFIQSKVDCNLLNKAKTKLFVLNSNSLNSHKGIFYDSKNCIIYEKMDIFDKVFDSKNIVNPNTGFSLNEFGFAHGENSGFCAVQTAILLGYSEIILIGIDLTFTTKTHFHGGYGSNSGDFINKLEKYYNNYVIAFSKLPITIKSGIYSGSSTSKLNKLIKKYDDVKPKKKYSDTILNRFNKNDQNIKNLDINGLEDILIIGYYTIDTPYEEEAKFLIESCRKLRLDYNIIGVKNLGSWQSNTRYKAKFIIDMLEQFPNKRLLYVDCDAVINRLPILFKMYEADISVHWQDFKWRKNECLSGTIYMENNEKTKKLCQLWLESNTNQPKDSTELEQWNLGKIIEQMRKTDGLIDKNLPPEYCQFDLIENIYPELEKGNGVIQHYQASRRFKNKV